MNAEEKLKQLQQELETHIKRTSTDRKNNKNKAFGLKILAVSFAGAITVLLGVRVEESWGSIFQNIALILSAIITILNAFEAFYDHRSLWIQGTITLSQRAALKSDVDYLAAGADGADLDAKALERYKERLQRILQDELRAWLKMRQESSPPSESQAKAAG